ncbi:MAG: helix-turn-helix transcriptional regulator [Anaerolineales bacterium]|nr:helix-turn-helix transcriptional regulator [Anaerolineales bacterium]
MWFLHRQRQGAETSSLSGDERGLSLELDPALAARLERAARARTQSPQELAATLLARGLDRAARAAQAAAALETLTPRQQDVARLIARGLTNRQIARQLVISIETVKTHVRNILEKFGAGSKSELRVLLLDLGVRWWQAGEAPDQDHRLD